MSNNEDKKASFITIAGTRIKLSNIKQYGVSETDKDGTHLGKYDPKKAPVTRHKSTSPSLFLDCLEIIGSFIHIAETIRGKANEGVQNNRLYITTFQNDNYSFYKEDGTVDI